MAGRQAEDARRAVGDDVECIDGIRTPQRLGVSLTWIGIDMDQKRNREHRYIRPTHSIIRLHLVRADGTATDCLGRNHMSISEGLLEKEDLRSRLFAETWRTLIPEVFRDVPTYYDKGNAVASLGSCSRWSAKFATAISQRLPQGANVLDVCSGTHDIPLRLLANDPTLEIHAVDGSPHMTAEGQRRARERNLVIHARVCDAHTLPFADNSFDAVTLQFASRHLEIIRAFKEIHRVLKPGGIFCHNDMLRPASRVVELPYLAYLRFSVWFTAKLFGSSAESMKCVGYFANAIRHFYTPRELAELLEGIGFAGIESRSFLTGVMSYHISRKPAVA
jgi:demethylmenaquinone methyltransferase/2-methoxy-6-polyprenyl-1,4-benzoquinol methylase